MKKKAKKQFYFFKLHRTSRNMGNFIGPLETWAKREVMNPNTFLTSGSRKERYLGRAWRLGQNPVFGATNTYAHGINGLPNWCPT